MDLISERVFRALQFLELVTQNGAKPTALQVDNFAMSDGPLGARYSSRFFDNFAKIALAWSGEMTQAPEKISAFLFRMEWATGSEAEMELTRVGLALVAGLRKESESSAETEAVPNTLVLEPNSPLSQIELAQAASQAGGGMFVDPYFQPQALPWLISSTTIARLLIKTPKVGTGAHATALGYTVGSDRLQVRAVGSGELHD